MKAELQAIQTILETITELKYIDEDWGQLDNYSPHFPTQFPLALVDIGRLVFENIGMDKSATPQNRQTGTGTVVITIANAKLTNTSVKAPQGQKDAAWKIWDIIEKVHAKLHGAKVTAKVGALVRISTMRMRRDDGIQEYEITYTIGATNV